MADLTVNQIPTNVNLTCDNCDEEINISYKEFTETYGECYDWISQGIKCPHCRHINTIEDWEFD